MQEQQAERLRVLWKSGRDKYNSFFAVLEEVRAEIGDEALPKWCVDNLQIGLSVITETRKVLLRVDAEIYRRNLEASVIIAEEQEWREREEERLRRELEKQERAKQIAEARAATERAKTDLEHARAETQKARNAEKRRQRQAEPDQVTKRQRRALIANVTDAELNQLVERFKKADAMCAEGIERWVEGSIAKAMVLCAARNRCPSNDKFGAWLSENEICLTDDDRAALIGLGSLGEARLRELLTATESRSYRLIWRASNRPPALKLVDGD
jgi:ATPase subunit of ABC transporter with duplicated ATPase domains